MHNNPYNTVITDRRHVAKFRLALAVSVDANKIDIIARLLCVLFDLLSFGLYLLLEIYSNMTWLYNLMNRANSCLKNIFGSQKQIRLQ